MIIINTIINNYINHLINRGLFCFNLLIYYSCSILFIHISTHLIRYSFGTRQRLCCYFLLLSMKRLSFLLLSHRLNYLIIREPTHSALSIRQALLCSFQRQPQALFIGPAILRQYKAVLTKASFVNLF